MSGNVHVRASITVLIFSQYFTNKFHMQGSGGNESRGALQMQAMAHSSELFTPVENIPNGTEDEDSEFIHALSSYPLRIVQGTRVDSDWNSPVCNDEMPFQDLESLRVGNMMLTEDGWRNVNTEIEETEMAAFDAIIGDIATQVGTSLPCKIGSAPSKGVTPHKSSHLQQNSQNFTSPYLTTGTSSSNDEQWCGIVADEEIDQMVDMNSTMQTSPANSILEKDLVPTETGMETPMSGTPLKYLAHTPSIRELSGFSFPSRTLNARPLATSSLPNLRLHKGYSSLTSLGSDTDDIPMGESPDIVTPRIFHPMSLPSRRGATPITSRELSDHFTPRGRGELLVKLPYAGQDTTSNRRGVAHRDLSHVAITPYDSSETVSPLLSATTAQGMGSTTSLSRSSGLRTITLEDMARMSAKSLLTRFSDTFSSGEHDLSPSLDSELQKNGSIVTAKFPLPTPLHAGAYRERRHTVHAGDTSAQYTGITSQSLAEDNVVVDVSESAPTPSAVVASPLFTTQLPSITPFRSPAGAEVETSQRKVLFFMNLEEDKPPDMHPSKRFHERPII